MNVVERENHYVFRVAWEHTDTAGYVHNSVYFRYFDLGECDWFRKLGIAWNQFPEVGFPRIHVEADFLRPLFFEDECCLVTRVTRVSGVKVILSHTLLRGEYEMARGTVVFGSVSTEHGGPVPLPKKMRETLLARVG